MVPAAPAVAVIDTAVAILEIAPDNSTPVIAHTMQDTVPFGGLVHLVLDYSPPPEGDLAIGPLIGADWLAPLPQEKPGLVSRILGKTAGPQPDLSGLPQIGEKFRAIHSFQVYRTNPFRLQVGTFLSPVIHVQGRIQDTQQTAAIRAPRSVGWSPLVILILLVILALILLVARWLWDRGSLRNEFSDRPLPAPAWLAAAIELRDLLQGGYLQRGDDRSFLDGLAGIERVALGTDYPFPLGELEPGKLIRSLNDLAEADRARLLGGTALEFLGLEAGRFA